MDSWTDKQIQMMRIGGNNKCIKFLASYDVAKSLAIPQKYNTPVALLYRDRISAEVNGLPLPTELPVVKSAVSQSVTLTNPAEMCEEDKARWIEDQMRLRDEVTPSLLDTLLDSNAKAMLLYVYSCFHSSYVLGCIYFLHKARERLKAKFGSCSGLSSSGTMAGIGSDSYYRPGVSSAQSSAALPMDVNLVEVSRQAAAFFSTTWSALSEQVVKVSAVLLCSA
jgi:hypothetical protein